MFCTAGIEPALSAYEVTVAFATGGWKSVVGFQLSVIG
jgi:hypothetical protein